MEKRCPKCETVKSVDEFFKTTASKSGYASLCKVCSKIADQKSREKKKQIKNGTYEEKTVDLEQNEYQKVILTNFKVCNKCNQNKPYKSFVAIKNHIMNRRDTCRDCEKIERNNLNGNTKKCQSCKETFDKSEFSSDNSRTDGLYGNCKNCKYKQDKSYKKSHPEQVKEASRKRMENPHEKIAHNLRTRIGGLIKNKTKSTFEYLEMSKSDFKDWLEHQFDDNMTWENYGSYWQIDHVIPCASFDFTNEDDIKKCFHWSNMQPLESKKNNSKSAKILEDDIKKHEKKVEKYKKKLNKVKEIVV